MRWALQTTLINTESALRIAEALRGLGKGFVMADHLPFTEEFVTDIEGDDYLPYGSTTLMKIAHKRGWKGLAFDPDTFRHTAWTYHNGTNMLNREACSMTVQEAAEEFAKWRPDRKMFIRPNDDLKLFNGGVLTAAEIAADFSNAVESSKGDFPPDAVVVFDYPKRIDAEWRCFVVDGNVVDSSMYRCEGRMLKRHEDNPAIKYQFQDFAGEWLPHRNCVMDVALTRGEFKILEFNCINASGFYDNNIELIISALSRSYGA